MLAKRLSSHSLANANKPRKKYEAKADDKEEGLRHLDRVVCWYWWCLATRVRLTTPDRGVAYNKPFPGQRNRQFAAESGCNRGASLERHRNIPALFHPFTHPARYGNCLHHRDTETQRHKIESRASGHRAFFAPSRPPRLISVTSVPLW